MAEKKLSKTERLKLQAMANLKQDLVQGSPESPVLSGFNIPGQEAVKTPEPDRKPVQEEKVSVQKKTPENIQETVKKTMPVQEEERKEEKPEEVKPAEEEKPQPVAETRPQEVKPSGDRKLTMKEYRLSALSSWGTNINMEIFLGYEYYAVVNGYKKYDLINSIIESHIEWEKEHPEFPEKEFVMENIRKRQAKKNQKEQEGERTNATFLLSEENRAFVAKRAASCGMKMFEFLEYLIPLYTG